MRRELLCMAVATVVLLVATSPAAVVLRLDAGQITGLNDGDSVTTWADLSGNGNDAAGVLGGNGTGLEYTSAAIHGRPAVWFDYVDDYFSIADAASLDVSSHTLFFVGYPYNKYIPNDPTLPQTWGILQKRSAAGTHYSLDYNIVPNTVQARWERGRLYGAAVADSGTVSRGTRYVTADDGALFDFRGLPLIGTGRFDAGKSSPVTYTAIDLFWQGLKETGYLDQTGPTAGTTFVNDDAIVIGTRHDLAANTWFRGYLGEVILFDAALTDQEILDINTYLSVKWDIPLEVAGGDAVEGAILLDDILGPLNPSPARNAMGVAPAALTLTWEAAGGADPPYDYDVYVDSNQAKVTSGIGCAYYSDNQSATNYTLSSELAYGTTYYWRVDVVRNGTTVKTGDVWSFTTSGKARNPSPADGSNVWENHVLLSWDADGIPPNYDVYISDNPSDLGTPVNTTEIEHLVAVDLNRTYYWRVDSKNSGGLLIAEGDVWSFNNEDPFKEYRESATAARAAAIPEAEADTNRPVFHYRPPAQWMNDVCGAIWHNGYYHAFYQNNPFSDTQYGWGWGHARSKDLVFWEELPFALLPMRDRSELRCNSGSATRDASGQAMLFYTFVPYSGARSQWAANPLDDDLFYWKRIGDEPLMVRGEDGIPADTDPSWSDPYVFKKDGRSFVTFKKVGGMICEAQNDTLTQWQAIGQIDGVGGECPNVF